MTSQSAAEPGPVWMNTDSWRLAAGLIAAAVAAILWLSWDSLAIMVQTWSRMSSYNHCWMILPIAGFLAWERRERLAGLSVEPFWPGLVLLAGFVAAWIFSRGAAIMEGQQLAVIGMIQSLLLVILGRKIFRAQIFPILYLWLLVPSGSFLLPALQWIATKITVSLLSLTSIPFFVENFYIQVPVGIFFIAPGCGGLNFLLAALALSVVYADLMYSGWRRKIACIAIWLAISIVANGVRIFVIIVLAQVSNKKLAIVDDHILYGWGFFIIIVFAMMWFGRKFSNYVAYKPQPGNVRAAPVFSSRALLSAGLAAIALVAAPLGYTRLAMGSGLAMRNLALDIPKSIGEWRQSEKLSLWDGAFKNADTEGFWRFRKASAAIDLAVGYYWDQWEGHEATAQTSTPLTPNGAQIIRGKVTKVVINGATRVVNERLIRIGPNEFVLWNWYCSGNQMTERPLIVQIDAAVEKLQRRKAPATVFTLITQEGLGAHDRLQDFLRLLTSDNKPLAVRRPNGKAARNAACW